MSKKLAKKRTFCPTIKSQRTLVKKDERNAFNYKGKKRAF